MVSVIIPAYNRENTIERAVMSVLNQTYKDLELIVVDDCSKDNTVEVLKSIKDDRLKIIELEKNSGACVARNVGIENAQGDYIAFQDSDDEWLLDKLEKQMAIFEKEKVDLVFCAFNRFGLGEDLTYPKLPEGIVERKVLLEDSRISTQTLIGKKECFENIKFDPEMPRLQDYDITIRLSKKYRIYFVNQPLVNMYVQNDSISKNNDKLLKAESMILSKYKDDAEKYEDFKYHNVRVLAIYKRIGGYKSSYEYKTLYKMKPSVSSLLKYIYTKVTDITKKLYKIGM